MAAKSDTLVRSQSKNIHIAELLIEMVGNYFVLYDERHPKHKDSLLKNDLWNNWQRAWIDCSDEDGIAVELKHRYRQPYRTSVEDGGMAAHGRFEPFVEEGDEDFESYVERFEHYLQATQVSAELRVSIFLTVVGKKAYQTLKHLLAPEKPVHKDYYLVKVLKAHYAPKIMVVGERLRFNRRVQQENEPVAALAIELKRLATSWKFGDF
ncbi:hypothetical protein HPB52_011947 [Rhipicephalus sanguineus]|uniref:Uncharacterized protein n=1 Tax=Rhipicephalus sanguineus TaxID=34632 RepID=A0A9D4PCA9_RHISA|nr:hypothetical protein HPB52_011947 [Rhipicephalus sanguineus]